MGLSRQVNITRGKKYANGQDQPTYNSNLDFTSNAYNNLPTSPTAPLLGPGHVRPGFDRQAGRELP